MARRAGLRVHGCFVIGLPGETKKTAQETIDFALSLGCSTVQFSAAIPFPGTKLYEYCREKGYLKTEDYSKWLNEGEQGSIIEYEDFTSQDMTYYVDKGLRSFYFRPLYMLKFLLDTRSFSDLYRKARGAYNFLEFNVSS